MDDTDRYVSIHKHIHNTCEYVHVHSYVCTYIWENMHIAYVHMHTFTHAHMYMHMHTQTHTIHACFADTSMSHIAHSAPHPFLFASLLFLMEFPHSSTTALLPKHTLADLLLRTLEAVSSILQRELPCIAQAHVWDGKCLTSSYKHLYPGRHSWTSFQRVKSAFPQQFHQLF